MLHLCDNTSNSGSSKSLEAYEIASMTTQVALYDPVVAAIRICHRLGFGGALAQITTQTVVVLHEELLSAAVTFQPSQTSEGIVNRYLNKIIGGLKKSPFSFKSRPSEEHLSLPNDYHEVKSIMILFLDLMDQHGNKIKEEADQASASTIEQGPTASPLSESNSQVTDAPLLRLARKDAQLLANLATYGISDLPLVFPSKDYMAECIDKWMKMNQSSSFPGSFTSKDSLLSKTPSLELLYFATTNAYVEVLRFKISGHYKGWVLRDESGHYMYLRSMPGNNDSRRRFVGWKGGHKGFTNKAIADTQKNNEAMQDRSLTAKQDASKNIKTETDALNGFSHGRNHFQEIDEELYEANSKASLRSTEGQDSSLQPTVPTRRCARLASKRFNYRVGLVEQRTKRKGEDEHKYSSQAKKLRFATDSTPSPSEFPHGLLSPPISPAKKQADIEIFFFTAREELGAVPASFRQCSTLKGFFDRALQAFVMSAPRSKEADLMAINALIDGIDWPLIIPWRHKPEFETMKTKLNEISWVSDTTVNVKVGCILKT
ncbi:uncharacterized protein KY384_000958 [Bacidia gigantensis]|uniref:uncharacterized protein n=1 Tax=Bacidia gigantensis TaxID=2732470 RepID=UPI001D05A855|nr:uncharacterized protein KY384_000958 [Bacidia gigantensis]KAG8534114.1 hypothetical protein KY384_000958 [Bacidia gigantensis]